MKGGTAWLEVLIALVLMVVDLNVMLLKLGFEEKSHIFHPRFMYDLFELLLFGPVFLFGRNEQPAGKREKYYTDPKQHNIQMVPYFLKYIRHLKFLLSLILVSFFGRGYI